MEEQKKESGINYVTWIVIAIIACVFIGIRVYTKYLEKQNQQYILEHYDEIQGYLHGEQTDSPYAALKETRLMFGDIDVNQSYSEVGKQMCKLYQIRYKEAFDPDIRYTSFEGTYEGVPDIHIGLNRNDDDLSTDYIELYNSVEGDKELANNWCQSYLKMIRRVYGEPAKEVIEEKPYKNRPDVKHEQTIYTYDLAENGEVRLSHAIRRYLHKDEQGNQFVSATISVDLQFRTRHFIDVTSKQPTIFDDDF